ncbi:type IV pilus biogenesis protein CpaD/CtpE [Rhodovulum iodosum]|uniref:Type IV pilus biogenesis protein CpaD/CtpE n=1 Tax=Rhodovulum iodosum TaxID=68291 RepID=A0ABV3XUZ9_9RHOB|nr:hypothetical protein [Rhodovulum robiginosum]RSK40771.1 hypothetical protein EJA01_00420 [Rhodovulum robiginosum]
MKLKIALGAVALAGLAGCVEETSTATAPMEPSPMGPPFITTFDPSVSNAAVTACRNTLDAQTDGAVEVVGSEFSQANTAIYMVVGPQRAPWRCLVSSDGSGASVMFMGDEGFL